MANRIRLIDTPPPVKVKLFMDSGVFGAWSRKMPPLDLKQYAKFINEFKHLLLCYATMDQIPGTPMTERTMADVESSAAAGYKNHQVLKDLGITPIPIFHQGEDFKWLEKYLRDDEPYIGLATQKDMPGDLSEYQEKWLDQMFSILTDGKGRPYVKTHGFGITKVNFLMRYPWTTCDSTTWSLAPGFGMIYVPSYSKDKPNYNVLPTRVIMSGRQQQSWSSQSRQYTDLGPMQRAAIDRYIEHCGAKVHEVKELSHARRQCCITYFNELCTAQGSKAFKYRRTVSIGAEFVKGHKAIKQADQMHVIFATMMHNRGFSRVLTDAGGDYRLISYLDLYKQYQTDPDAVAEALTNYVTLGIDNLSYTPRKPKTGLWNENYMSHRRLNLFNRIKEQANGTHETD